MRVEGSEERISDEQEDALLSHLGCWDHRNALHHLRSSQLLQRGRVLLATSPDYHLSMIPLRLFLCLSSTKREYMWKIDKKNKATSRSLIKRGKMDLKKESGRAPYHFFSSSRFLSLQYACLWVHRRVFFAFPSYLVVSIVHSSKQ